MVRLLLVTVCLTVLIFGCFADKEYTEHSHDHHGHHHAHDGRKLEYLRMKKNFLLMRNMYFLDDHHDHESHKKLFAG